MSNIADTRAQMDDTLDELSERLKPRHILNDVLDYFRSRRESSASRKPRGRVRRAAGQTGYRVKQTAGAAGRVAARQVRQHPIPALLIGAGITALFMERYRPAEVEYYEMDGDYSEGAEVGSEELESMEGIGPEQYALPSHYSEGKSPGMMEKIKEKGSQLREKAGSSFQSVKHSASEKSEALRHRASETGSHLKEKAQHTYEHSLETFKRTSDEHPLGAGLACLALGVVAGMLLPSTRKEDEMVGPTRDRLMQRSRDVAEKAMAGGKHVAQAAMDAATSEARAQGLTPAALKEKAQAVASQVKETTRQDAMQQTEELKRA